MNKIYFVHFGYGATGEGMTDSIGIIITKEKEKKEIAKEFLKKYSYNDLGEQSLEYFSLGTKVYDLSRKENEKYLENMEYMEKILKQFLTEKYVDYIMNAEKNDALFEFNFHCYINYS